MATSNKLLSAQGLVIETFSDTKVPGQYLPPTASSIEAQLHFITGNLAAYQATGNKLAREAAEKALFGLLKSFYRNAPVPDVPTSNAVFSPNVAVNAGGALNSGVIRYNTPVNFVDGVGYIPGPDNVIQVYRAVDSGFSLTWQNPYAPVSPGGNSYAVNPVWAYDPEFGTKINLASNYTGQLWVINATGTGQQILPGQVFSDWPTWSLLRPDEVHTPGFVYADATKAFGLASEMLGNPTWTQAAASMLAQAARLVDIPGWRDFIAPNWAYDVAALSNYLFISDRQPMAQLSVDDNGLYVFNQLAATVSGTGVSLSNGALADVYRASDTTEVIMGSNTPMTAYVYFESDAAGSRWIAPVAISGVGLQTITLTLANFASYGNVPMPANTPIVRAGVYYVEDQPLTFLLQSLRQVPVVPGRTARMPGLIPYQVYIGGNPPRLLDDRGPTYIGYQSPDLLLRIGSAEGLANQIALLRDAQSVWPGMTGQPIKGPFAPVFYPAHSDLIEYGAYNTFGWEGPDHRTQWGGYQYRPTNELVRAAMRLGPYESVTTDLLKVSNGMLNWLAQDRTWLPMWAPWANTFSDAIERSLALGWAPIPVVPDGANAFADAINKASAHGYTPADTSVPMLPSWDPFDYPYGPDLTFPSRPPFGPPTDFPLGAEQINYPSPQLAAIVLLSVVQTDGVARPRGNNQGAMRVELRALLGKSLALLEVMWVETGDMAGTFSPDPDHDEWYGAWHGDILEALSATYTWAIRPAVNRPDVAERVLPWIIGLINWGKLNTGVSGSPLVRSAWRYPPNWNAGVTEEFSYSTSMFTSFNGREQRLSMRVDPRRKLTLMHLLKGDEARSYDSVLAGRQNTPVAVPQWHLYAKTTAPATAGQDYLDTTLINQQDFIVGQPIAIMSLSGLVIMTLGRVDDNRIYLVGSLLVNVGEEAKILPTSIAFLDADVSSSRVTNGVLTGQVAFSFLPQTDQRKLPDLPAEMMFKVGDDEREVILSKPNWSSSPNVGHSWVKTDTSDFINGPVTMVNSEARGRRTISATWSLRNEGQINRHLGLIKRLHGRRYAAWLPTWTIDFVMTRASGELNRLYVKPNESCDLGLLDDSCVGIFLRMRDGTHYAARVLGTTYGETEYSLILDRALPRVIQRDELHTFSLLYRVRQMSDTCTLKWITDSVAETVVTFTSVFDEI